MGEVENTIELIKDHLQRGDKSLKSAEVLAREELMEDAISRAYYAAYHAMKSLVTAIGEESRTHRGLQHRIFTHFVKSGIISKELHKQISHLLSYRSDADYGVIPIFNQDEVEQAIHTATETMKIARNWLGKKYNTEF